MAHLCCFAAHSLFRDQSNEDIETMKGAERNKTRSTTPIDHVRERRR
jgi:hypothetical protein